MTDQNRFYAGVDWASESHLVFLTNAEGRKIGEREFKHSGEGLAEMMAWLMAASGAAEPSQIEVAIEVPHGPVVEALMERGFAVHAINPKQMDRFRDRFSLAGAKDDSRDAEVMASALRTDAHCFRRLSLVDPTLIELREWSRIAEDLESEHTRLTNRLRDQLWRYFPAILELGGDLGADFVLDLLKLVPTPDRVARLRESAIARLLKQHRIRRFDAAHVMEVLRKPPLRLAEGTTAAASAHVGILIARIRPLNQQIKQAQRQIDLLIARLAPAEETEPGQ
jgi:transposase